MKLTYLGLLTIMSTGLGVSAGDHWEITAYSNAVDNCNPPSDPGDKGMYRILSGTDGKCHNIYGAAPGVDCQQYNNGGFDGPVDCGNDRIQAGSIDISGNVYCQTYASHDCTNWNQGLYGCVNPLPGVWSFQCGVTTANGRYPAGYIQPPKE